MLPQYALPGLTRPSNDLQSLVKCMNVMNSMGEIKSIDGDENQISLPEIEVAAEE